MQKPANITKEFSIPDTIEELIVLEQYLTEVYVAALQCGVNVIPLENWLNQIEGKTVSCVNNQKIARSMLAESFQRK